MTIRRASPADASGIAAVIEVVAAERVYSAIDRAWTVDEERQYLASLSPREAIHVAVDTLKAPRAIANVIATAVNRADWRITS